MNPPEVLSTLLNKLPLSLAAVNEAQLTLPRLKHWPESHHVFDERSLRAVHTALASGRPLLLRGEPGSGKSQLARAANLVYQLMRFNVRPSVFSSFLQVNLIRPFDPRCRIC
jgi:MoxR-like ATPase